jgi:hypothetical protein
MSTEPKQAETPDTNALLIQTLQSMNQKLDKLTGDTAPKEAREGIPEDDLNTLFGSLTNKLFSGMVDPTAPLFALAQSTFTGRKSVNEELDELPPIEKGVHEDGPDKGRNFTVYTTNLLIRGQVAYWRKDTPTTLRVFPLHDHVRDRPGRGIDIVVAEAKGQKKAQNLLNDLISGKIAEIDQKVADEGGGTSNDFVEVKLTDEEQKNLLATGANEIRFWCREQRRLPEGSELFLTFTEGRMTHPELSLPTDGREVNLQAVKPYHRMSIVQLDKDSNKLQSDINRYVREIEERDEKTEEVSRNWRITGASRVARKAQPSAPTGEGTAEGGAELTDETLPD